MTSGSIGWFHLSASAGSAGIQLSYLKNSVKVCIVNLEFGFCSNSHVVGIAALDQSHITLSAHRQQDELLFPSPSDSLNLSHTHLSYNDSLASPTLSQLSSSWSDGIGSADITFPTFSDPAFTSTPLPQLAALPVSKDCDLTASDILASGITKRRTTRGLGRSSATGVSSAGALVPPPSRPFVLATQSPTKIQSPAKVVAGTTRGLGRSSATGVSSAGALVPPPSRPFVLATRSPTKIQSPAKVVAANAKGSDKHKVRVLTLGITLTLMKKMLRLTTKYLLLIMVHHQWAPSCPQHHTCLPWQHGL
jgi:hypothetical protein